MSSFAINGGKVNEEGHGKPWLHLFRQGYVRGLGLTQRAAGANMSVDVNLDSSGYGSALLATSAGVAYFGWIDATTNVPIATANPSNGRIDVVVAWVDLSLITSSVTNNTGAFKITAVPGTAAASPSAPNAAAIQSAIGSANPYIVLGQVSVGAAASNIINGGISSSAVPAALAMPYLYGGSNNTVGHLVPNIADGKVIVSTDTGAVGPSLLSPGAISLGYAAITSPLSTTSSTVVAAGSLTTSVIIPPGNRQVKVTFWTRGLYNPTANTAIIVSIWDGPIGTGGTELTQAAESTPNGATGANETSVTAVAIVNPSAGYKAYSVGWFCTGGTANMRAASNFPAFILVEAI